MELKGGVIAHSDLSGVRMRDVNLSNVVVTDSWLFNAELWGNIAGLKVNGVEVAPLVEAELDRRHPERTRLSPRDIAGVLAGLDTVEQMWAPTIERARGLSRPELLHERVDGEYSFVETLRHLIFATDAWLTRMVLQVPNGYHEWGVPPDLPSDAPPDTGPGLDEVLAVRAERFERLRTYLSETTEDDLRAVRAAPDPTGHPQGTHRVIDCFRLVLGEEWWHHQYASRDLAVLESR